MDDSLFPVFGNPSESIMDFDYMDELLLDGCWLQATDGSEFLNNSQTQSQNTSNPLFDPSFLWSTLEYPSPNDVQQERKRSSFYENLSISQTEEANSSKESKPHLSISQTENFLDQDSEIGRRWWIPPRMNPGPSLSVTERLIYAIENVKHYSIDKNLLIQVWLPETKEGKKVLSTENQLFALDSNNSRLLNYRNISENYRFSADADSRDVVGLPGRVFLGKVPEWTPDVRFFRTDEYPRVGHAQQFDVRGSVAIPIFDRNNKSCLGVIEVVMTTQKSNYATEIQSVCQALETVDLRSSEGAIPQNIKESDGSYQAALPEILEILKSACQTHNLPLAQTWVRCIQQGKGGCRHSDENLIHCISTVDSACFVNDQRFKDFQEACSDHHLLKGQGVVGRAFATNQPCYVPDVTSYTKTEYPLAHHARIFDLHGVVAIRLRSTYTAMVDYVLEFFLPVDCKSQTDQKGMLNSLSKIIQCVCRSLRIVTDDELEEEVPKIEEIYDQEILIEKGVGLTESQRNEGNKKAEKRRGGAKTEKTVTLQMLRQHFAGSLKDAAKNIGVCPTTLKRICRQHGIQRWPSRKIKKVGHSLQKIQLVMDSVHGASGSFQIESFYSNFPELASPDFSKNPTFSASNVKTADSKTIDDATKSSLSPSCSQSLSSGQSCSSGSQPYPNTPAGEDTGNGFSKRSMSNSELHVSNDHEPKIIPRSHSHISLHELPKSQSQSLPPKPRVSNRNGLHRVKVTYGEEKVRFRMQKDWGYMYLLQEIAKRFNINDISEFHLKYFDDDSEWVLLTCDADLEECIDVSRSCKSETIKLSLHEPQHPVVSSLGSTAPLTSHHGAPGLA